MAVQRGVADTITLSPLSDWRSGRAGYRMVTASRIVDQGGEAGHWGLTLILSIVRQDGVLLCPSMHLSLLTPPMVA